MLAIHWDFNPEIIEGWKTPNYYGLLFVTGLVLGYFVMRKMYKKAGMDDASLDKLVLYVVVATIVGARLGHVFFYDWDAYKNNLVDIFKIWEGGLASHGGAIALVIALMIYSRRVIHKPFLWIFDRIAAPIAIAGAFIRLGNFANSEIVGKETDVAWGVKFMQNDCPAYLNSVPCDWAEIPTRHATQLYEAFGYLSIFVILMFLFWKKEAWKRPGILFGTFLILLFGFRIFIEYFKVGQTDYDNTLTFNTGQMLSVPFVLAGIGILIYALRKKTEASELEKS